MGQGGHAHRHALALLGLGRAGGGEADPDDLVDGGEQAELVRALEVPGGESMPRNELRLSAPCSGRKVTMIFNHIRLQLWHFNSFICGTLHFHGRLRPRFNQCLSFNSQ